MNATLETTTVETTATETKIPFPSQVKNPAPNSEVMPYASPLVDNTRDMNNIMEAAGNVHKLVRGHYVNMATGVYGIERLIASILANAEAVFPPDVEKTEFRAIAVAKSFYAVEVISAVREHFGAERYPDSVIATYLAHYMQKETSANRVGAIQLTKTEDMPRPCPKPRTKYYLLDIPATPAITVPE